MLISLFLGGDLTENILRIAAETGCLKAKTLSKLNSTEIDLLAMIGSNFQEGQN